MARRFPRRVKLGDEVWTLHVCEKIPQAYKSQFTEKELENMWGCTIRELMGLWAERREQTSPQIWKQTVMHEIAHALVYGFVFEHVMPDDENEVERLGKALYSFVMNNRDLIKALWEEDSDSSTKKPEKDFSDPPKN